MFQLIPTHVVKFRHADHEVVLRVPRDDVPPLIKLLIFNGISEFSSEEENLQNAVSNGSD